MNNESLNLLIVDDDKEYTKNIQKRFLEYNFKTDVTNNGEEAISKISKNGYDVGLLDLDMGQDDDGISIAKRMLEKKPKFHIIFSTHVPKIELEQYKKEAFESNLNITEWLRKPREIYGKDFDDYFNAIKISYIKRQIPICLEKVKMNTTPFDKIIDECSYLLVTSKEEIISKSISILSNILDNFDDFDKRLDNIVQLKNEMLELIKYFDINNNINLKDIIILIYGALNNVDVINLTKEQIIALINVINMLKANNITEGAFNSIDNILLESNMDFIPS